MPASIRVETGISAGTNYWIDRPVLRIGSDPQCEICLPTADLAPHALTLEFRDGNYRAYNRGSLPVTVGTTAVQPGANGVWRGDQSVHLPGDLRLLLEIDGDPRPCPRPEARLDDGFAENGAALAAADAGAAGAAKEKKSSSTLVQMGIIGACILAMGAFLTMDRGPKTSAPDRPTFEAIVQNTLANDKNAAARAILPRLQYAEAAVVRGHGELARSRFLKLRDVLVRQKESLPAEEGEDAKRMLEYVEYRLGQLQ
jgi:hypothetical protein